MAMGQSIIRSHQLGVNALQLLINDPARSKSLTTHHKTDWVSKSQTDTYGIHFDLKGSPEELRTIMQNNHTGGILVSDKISNPI